MTLIISRDCQSHPTRSAPNGHEPSPTGSETWSRTWPHFAGSDAVLQICSQCQGVVAADVGGGWDPAAGDLARRFAASPRRDGMNW